MTTLAANWSLADALAEEEARFAAANPRSRERALAAAAVMPGGNTRTVLHYTPFPLAFAKGEGATLTDLDGHTYRDFLGEYSAGLYGHSHPVIVAAAKRAIEDGIALGGPNMYEAKLASAIAARFPSVERIRFTNSGTEANLMALVTALAASGRKRVLGFRGGYHGGVLTLKPGALTNVPFDLVLARYNDLASVEAVLREGAEQVACAIVEPVMGGAGAIPGTPEFLHGLRALTARHGILLILDEVMTSRHGAGGVQGLYGIRPDLTTFGKYLGGGFSFGAFGGRADLMERYDPYRPDAWAHAGTFNNNVTSMAAGHAGLAEVFTPAAAEALFARGERLRARLNAAAAAEDVPVRATGLGSMIGIHPTDREITAAEDAPEAKEARALIHLALIARGIYMARRGYMTLSLPQTAEDDDALVAAFADMLRSHARVLRDAAAG
ncbi:aminotransferase class III-fold pyridoxal phosphate-dependent enzyme [Elioraea sp. Yellowstone]|jgi:glutamate-1-semialdehyde 2,1-aminomutase|uniref:aspartate aminotransferase family protein n=1 Tax=Elioraea sp. Yellowstone TaxID=2592070 RepID=UPI00114FDBA4|nr:aminotransferase class III-fold pyridoxal phosphate-dependent enzyme [Elioraea sp. Yellowstone]TQF77743.1 aminotransferase class III-fold pyridoxal phosphate-dependent enzyme [Elioraea sp. Yellowstone]